MPVIGRFEIVNRLGMHARAAASFVQLANEFVSEVRVRKDSIEVNGKSIMGMLQLAAARGNVIEVEVDGDDAQVAVTALRKLVATKFGEEE